MDQSTGDHSNRDQSKGEESNGEQSNDDGDNIASLSRGHHQRRTVGSPSGTASSNLVMLAETIIRATQDNTTDEVSNEEEDRSEHSSEKSNDVVGEGDAAPVCIEERERPSGRVEAEVLGAGGSDIVCSTSSDHSSKESRVLGAGGADIVCSTRSEDSEESTARVEAKYVHGATGLGEADFECTAESQEESSGENVVGVISGAAALESNTQESEGSRTAEAGAGQSTERGEVIPVLPVERSERSREGNAEAGAGQSAERDEVIPILPVERWERSREGTAEAGLDWDGEHLNTVIAYIPPDGRGRPEILLRDRSTLQAMRGRGMPLVLRPMRKRPRSAAPSHDRN